MDYESMLKRAIEKIPESVKQADRFEIPNIVGYLEGSKTILSNFVQIANLLHRKSEHMLKYILRELATKGEIRHSGHVMINSKISSSRINDKIKQYAKEFVICRECGKPDTKIIKEGDSTSLRCMACGAKYPIRGKI